MRRSNRSAPGLTPDSCWCRSRLVVAEQGPVSRSSPNTPLLARRLGHKPRNQSFSPVRSADTAL